VNPLLGQTLSETYNVAFCSGRNQEGVCPFRLESEKMSCQETCVTEEDLTGEENPLEEDGVEDTSSGAAPTRVNPEHSLKLALAAARTAGENGGSEIVVLDMSKHTAIFDYFVIATGTSRRQLHAISEEIDNTLEKELDDKRMNIDGYDDSKWIVLDYGTVVIHLFDEDTRTFYSLEALWGDAEKVDLTEALRTFVNVRFSLVRFSLMSAFRSTWLGQRTYFFFLFFLKSLG
jgi:ribosome-associated protein